MSGGDQRDERAARLAEALRENLRRRKAQARSRRDAAAEESPGAAPESDEVREAGEDGPRE